MTRFINRFTSTEMWVADERIEEYKSAGHMLADEAPSAKPIVEDKPQEKVVTKKTTIKKATTAKKK